MMQQLSHLVGKNLSMGIDAESASVTELTPRQLCIAATTAFNRGVEVLLSALSGSHRKAMCILTPGASGICSSRDVKNSEHASANVSMHPQGKGLLRPDSVAGPANTTNI